MPKQIFNAEKFKSLSKGVIECRVVKIGSRVKLKLRTSRMLYVFITSKEEADRLLNELKVEVKEIE
ncbi:MAG: hypothetical protein ACUVWK_00410 [Nitrososphaerales archaeon]